MTKDDNLKSIFGDWYIQLSKPTIKIFGLEAALMLCNLYSEYRYWKSKKKLSSEEWGSFYSTVENIEHNTGLSKNRQLKAIKVLEEYGIIKKYLHGNPPKRYFMFLESGIDKLLLDVQKEIQKDKDRKKENIEKYGKDDIIYIYETGEIIELDSTLDKVEVSNEVSKNTKEFHYSF